MKVYAITLALLLVSSSQAVKVRFTDFFPDEENTEIQNKINEMSKADVAALAAIDHKIDQA